MVKPDRKVTVGGVVGSVVTISAWAIHEGFGVQIPPGVEGAFVVLLTFIVSYWVTNDDINKVKSVDNGRSNRGGDLGEVDNNEVTK